MSDYCLNSNHIIYFSSSGFPYSLGCVFPYKLSLLAIWCIFCWIFVVSSMLIGRTCEVRISEYYYGQLCKKIETYGRDIKVLEKELKQASETSHFPQRIR
ncbi:hypothetical protein Glove_368g35 [Diversispora epigaea]|uniref:Uncharacterized protein n=1 Tax=Diversispora epigaea TaxID=1348612 RepID=A0A397H800_9GLOM|nr:hypothetical protein Glove_368g35 [Diversispora epigaea]